MQERLVMSRLTGVPVFCIDRIYRVGTGSEQVRSQWIFEFENTHRASVIEFADWSCSGGDQYEIFSSVTGGNQDSGSAEHIDQLLQQIQQAPAAGFTYHTGSACA